MRFSFDGCELDDFSQQPRSRNFPSPYGEFEISRLFSAIFFFFGTCASLNIVVFVFTPLPDKTLIITWCRGRGTVTLSLQLYSLGSVVAATGDINNTGEDECEKKREGEGVKVPGKVAERKYQSV